MNAKKKARGGKNKKGSLKAKNFFNNPATTSWLLWPPDTDTKTKIRRTRNLFSRVGQTVSGI